MMEKKDAFAVNFQIFAEKYKEFCIATLVVLISIILFFIYRQRRSIRRSILFMGLCESGKTVLHTQLTLSKFVKTVTSIEANIGDYRRKKDVLQLVDIPGHERLRNKFFDRYKATARGIVYVVNSLTIVKDVRDVAEYLHVILTDSVLLQNAPKVMILCNKQDDAVAKGSDLIKSLLEKEMNTVRLTKLKQLESVDPKSNNSLNVILGEGDDFDFTQVPPYSVEFCEAQVTKSDVQLDPLKKWLIENV